MLRVVLKQVRLQPVTECRPSSRFLNSFSRCGNVNNVIETLKGIETLTPTTKNHPPNLLPA